MRRRYHESPWALTITASKRADYWLAKDRRHRPVLAPLSNRSASEGHLLFGETLDIERSPIAPRESGCDSRRQRESWPWSTWSQSGFRRLNTREGSNARARCSGGVAKNALSRADYTTCGALRIRFGRVKRQFNADNPAICRISGTSHRDQHLLRKGDTSGVCRKASAEATLVTAQHGFGSPSCGGALR